MSETKRTYEPLVSKEEIAKAPIFEIIDGDKHYKIWANSKVEGFNPDGLFIVNRIAAIIPMMEARHLERMKDAISPGTDCGFNEQPHSQE
jgi:hypothetical protein